MTTPAVDQVAAHIKKLQEMVDLEVAAVKEILGQQLSQSPKDKENIAIMLNSFLEQNSWAIGRLRGSLELSTMIQDGHDETVARNQQGHPTKTILLRADPADKI